MSDDVKTASQMLSEARQAITAVDVARAIGRANQMFDSAPWLARAATHVPGCANLTYTDLHALVVAAELRQLRDRN